MTPKERFLNTLKAKPVDRIPFMEIALWAETVTRWVAEGAPPDLDAGLMAGNVHFGLEGYDCVEIDAIAPRPPFPSCVLEEDDEHIRFTDGFGRTGMARKGNVSMHQYFDYAVKDRQSFLAMRTRYEGLLEERYPADWDAVCARVRATDKPVTLMNPLSGTFGFYSMLRNWCGTEPLSYLFDDDPALIHDCVEFLLEFAMRLFSRALREVKFDFYYIHEDMAGKGGPLMGPQLFREFLLPSYMRFVEFLKSQGMEIVLVDTDGDFAALLPLFLEAGVDGFGPIEIAAGMDPLQLRQQYGTSFCMVGGIDKREIARGKAAIDAEIKKITPLIHQGGFIPTIDHAVPPDVSYADFCYYLEEKRRVIWG